MILDGWPKAKADSHLKTDTEGRNRGSQKGLGTPVVYDDNDEHWCFVIIINYLANALSVPPE